MYVYYLRNLYLDNKLREPRALTMGGGTSVGTSITFDREAADLGEPKDVKFEFNASHTFDNEVVLGASVDYSNTASSDSATDNLEGTAGYRLRIHNAFVVIGSAGIGERFQTSGSGSDFPYYVFRVATDWWSARS